MSVLRISNVQWGTSRITLSPILIFFWLFTFKFYCFLFSITNKRKMAGFFIWSGVKVVKRIQRPRNSADRTNLQADDRRKREVSMLTEIEWCTSPRVPPRQTKVPLWVAKTSKATKGQSQFLPTHKWYLNIYITLFLWVWCDLTFPPLTHRHKARTRVIH